MSTIRVEADELIRKLTSLAQFRKVKAAVTVAGKFIRGKMATYPSSRHGPAIPRAKDWSAKQRRGFFAKLRSGEIEVPYRRGASSGSERLGSKWTTQSANAGMTAIVGNNASYVRLVQDAENQTRYHKMTGWPTDDQVMRDHGPTVVEYIRQAIEREIAE